MQPRVDSRHGFRIAELLVTPERAIPSRLCVVVARQAPECLAPQCQRLGPFPDAVAWEQLQGSLDEAQRLFEGADRHRVRGCHREVARRPERVGRRARLVEVVGDLGRPLVRALAVATLQRIRDGKVVRLQARQRQRREHSLADEVVAESESIGPRGPQEMASGRFVDRIAQLVA